LDAEVRSRPTGIDILGATTPDKRPGKNKMKAQFMNPQDKQRTVTGEA
jgi:hypothetical protein